MTGSALISAGRSATSNHGDSIQKLTVCGRLSYNFWRYHSKVKEFLVSHNDWMITRRIPAYSLNLNPDKFVWNILKYQELHNFCPNSAEDRESTVEATMTILKYDPARVRKAIRGSKFPLPA